MPNYTPDLSTFKNLASNHNLIPIYREISADLETPVSAYLKTGTGKLVPLRIGRRWREPGALQHARH